MFVTNLQDGADTPSPPMSTSGDGSTSIRERHSSEDVMLDSLDELDTPTEGVPTCCDDSGVDSERTEKVKRVSVVIRKRLSMFSNQRPFNSMLFSFCFLLKVLSKICHISKLHKQLSKVFVLIRVCFCAGLQS